MKKYTELRADDGWDIYGPDNLYIFHLDYEFDAKRVTEELNRAYLLGVENADELAQLRVAESFEAGPSLQDMTTWENATLNVAIW